VTRRTGWPVGRGEHEWRVSASRGERSAIDGARQRKTVRAEPGHEVAAPHLSSFFEQLEHRIQPGEAALEPSPNAASRVSTP